MSDKERNSSSTISVDFTAEELELIQRAAESVKMSVEDFVKEAALEHATKFAVFG